MPGIYVRKAKWFDWIQQRENPVLTVPGSYWLCHKNNIYKFIFKYHRTIRNVEKFSFGRELMKVIRRIIKSQPRQGQQFGTSHLLVTYNQTAWTRQDKMFALLKFKERSVAAFSHAFVLTIKILFSMESTEQNGNYVMTFPFPDESLIRSDEDLTSAHAYKNANKEENVSLTHPPKNDLPEKINQYDDMQEEVLKSENKSIRLDNSLIVTNSKETFTNEQAVKYTTNCKDTSKITKSLKVSLELFPNVSIKNSTELNNRQKKSKHSRLNAEESKKENRDQSVNSTNSMSLNSITNEVGENEDEINLNCLEEENIDNNSFFFQEMTVKDIKLPNNSNKLLETDEYVNKNDSIQHKAVSNINEVNSTNSMSLNSITNEVGENEDEINLNFIEEENIDNSFSFEEINVNDIKLPNNSNELFEIDEYTTEKDSIQYKALSDINEVENSTVDAINMDSTNLPYQYLIEKEIEDAKHRTTNTNDSKNDAKTYDEDEQNYRKRKLEEVNEKHSTSSTELLTNCANIEDFSYHKKRKHTSDNMTSRSSDITNQVMEGLMLTIREGEDTVAVIEQKTELEIDEVLENSEKIETKKGEKCLLNSSLLGLENLITMIELPKQAKAEHKCHNTLIEENSLKSPSINKPLFNDIKHSLTDNGTNQHNTRLSLKHTQWQSSTNNASLASTSFTTNNVKAVITKKDQYPEVYDVDKYDEDKKFVENEDPECEQEEEDIVPEVLQDKRFQAAVLFFKEANKPKGKFKVMSNTDLLMDDIDTEDSIKFETMRTECSSLFSKDSLPKVRSRTDCPNNYIAQSNEQLMKSIMNEIHKHGANTLYKSKFNDTEKHRLNVPKIISNEIITVDQIPLPLRKMLKNESSVMPASNKNEVDESSSEDCKVQSCQTEDTASNTQLNSQTLDCNILEDTQCLKNSYTFMHSSMESHEESTSSVASRVKLKNVNILENSVQLKEEKPRKQNVSVHEEDQLPQNEIQDITHEFYQDLLYQQKKKDVTNQKYLRLRRKSQYALRDTNDGETRIQMAKFLHDITRGAKVVVRRLSTKSIHSIIEKSSSLATCRQH